MVKFIIFEELSVRTGSVLKHQGITTWDQVPDDLMKMRMPRAIFLLNALMNLRKLGRHKNGF